MASKNNRSPVSSRSASPDAYSAQYDPFVSPEDPVEMSHLSRPSMDTLNPRDRTSHSPESTIRNSTTRGGFRPASYLTSHTNTQYARLSGSNEPSGLRSASASIYSVGSVNPYSTKDADAQALADRRAGEIAEWHIHWTTPAMIAALFVAGVMAAVGHHLFYVSLDGKEASNQLLMVRYGTALAFFVKSTLVGTVIMCYRQRIWSTLRKKAMTINGIDGLFSATEDPTQFLTNLEMMRNGKLATLMAFCSWLIPIASVLSPASLTSEMRTTFNMTECPHVASLNFSRESYYDFRTGGLYKGVSLSYFNTTDIKGETEGFFDYYDQPSKNLRRLAISSAYSKKTPQAVNASIDNCGNGWNCTYTINFMGPGYKCEEIGDDNAARLSNAPFNYSIFAPIGSSMYHSNVDVGDYKSPQVESNDNGTPKEGPPYPESLGVFDSEPILWVGYAINKTDEPYPDDSLFKEKWKTVHEPHIFKCVMHHTKYTFEMNYEDSNQRVNRKQRDFVKPVVDTTLSMKSAKSNETVANPKENFISPSKDPEAYKLAASYHSIGSLLRNFLRGEISKASAESFMVTKSDVSETRLVDSASAYPVENLMDAVQELFEDMLITLLSEPYLVIATREKVKCEKYRTRNTYVYHRDSLWVGYALAVAITLGSIVIGAWAIHQNGVASDTLFSRILVTTRNPTLDRLAVGACLGGDPFPKELRETKLRFGVLLEDMPREGPLGKVEHCTFGTAGETKDIVKYGTYAGLQKYRKEAQQEEGQAWEKENLLEEYELEMEPVD